MCARLPVELLFMGLAKNLSVHQASRLRDHLSDAFRFICDPPDAWTGSTS